jgi:hypothetical protein
LALISLIDKALTTNIVNWADLEIELNMSIPQSINGMSDEILQIKYMRSWPFVHAYLTQHIGIQRTRHKNNTTVVKLQTGNPQCI